MGPFIKDVIHRGGGLGNRGTLLSFITQFKHYYMHIGKDFNGVLNHHLYPSNAKMLWKSTIICINLITKTGNSLTKATQLFIYFRKKGKHVNFLVMAA